MGKRKRKRKQQAERRRRQAGRHVRAGSGGVGSGSAATGPRRGGAGPSRGGPSPGAAGRGAAGRGGADRGGGRAGAARFEPRAVNEVIDRAVAASCGLESRAGPAGELVDALARGPAHPEGPALVDRALGRALVEAVSGAWARGWQPADLHRMVQRAHGRAHDQLSAVAMGREARRYADETVPVRWRLQLDAVGAEPTSHAGERWAVPVTPEGADLWGDGVPSFDHRVDAVRVAVETLSLIRRLPPLPKLAPGPGEATEPRSQLRGQHPGQGPHRLGRAPEDDASAGADPRVLHRVSALLAKAESTTFPDEAEALTAKAQQLMTRHAIDMAAIDAERGGGPRVSGRRIGVDDPYARARVTLLSQVADANRCRAVWSQAFGFATVFGDEGDLDAVEMLFTSLLVQATRAMVVERPPNQPHDRRGGRGAGDRAASGSATRSFRQSFLVAYAHRIGDRLRQATEAAAAEAEAETAGARSGGGHGGRGALLPVLARRAEAAEAAAAAAFPRVKTFSTTARDAQGWAAGRQAADRADLGLQGTLPGRHPPSPRSLGAA
jgi:hypothetical protein